MGVIIIDGSTVRDFFDDEAHFTKTANESFAALDLNNDKVLSRSKLWRAFETLRLIETHFGVDVATAPEELTKLYSSIFKKFDCDHSGTVDFDCDHSGTVDLEEFRNELRKILLAIADGLGFSPIQITIEDDGSCGENIRYNGCNATCYNQRPRLQGSVNLSLFNTIWAVGCNTWQLQPL